MSLYDKQFYYWESLSFVPRDLNPVRHSKIQSKWKIKESTSVIPFYSFNSVKLTLKFVESQHEIVIVDCSLK